MKNDNNFKEIIIVTNCPTCGEDVIVRLKAKQGTEIKEIEIDHEKDNS